MKMLDGVLGTLGMLGTWPLGDDSLGTAVPGTARNSGRVPSAFRDRQQPIYKRSERLILLQRTRHLASSLTLIFALDACALAQSQPPSPSATPIQRGTEADPLFVRETRNQEQAAEDREDRDSQRANRNYTLFLGFMSVVVAGAQIWLLVRQNAIIKGQSDVMERQAKHMEDGLAETRKAADAAVAALKHSQAPLVLFEGIVSIGDLSPDVALTAVVKNYGPGTATVQVVITVAFKRMALHKKNTRTPTTIGPTGTANIATEPLKTFMTGEQIAAVQAGGSTLTLGVAVTQTVGTETVERLYSVRWDHNTKSFARMEITRDTIVTWAKQLAAAKKKQAEQAKPDTTLTP